MKQLPKFTEFKRCISKTGWKGLDKKGKWVDITADQVIEYLLFRNFHNEDALQVSAQTQMCVHCEGWMRWQYAKEAIQYKPNCWLHVTCVPQWLSTTCDPEVHDDIEWQDLAERFAKWFMRASRTPDVMEAHRCLKQHFSDYYTNACTVISLRH
jgi:hypothetical protein